MFSGGGLEATGPCGSRRKAYVEIVEQPASKALRFRYECEGRSAGSIPGVKSTPEIRTFPSIRIEGYKGRAVVVVSCVTKDAPHRPHPHNLVGKEGCRSGVCTVEVAPDSMTATFANLGIQCVKKKDIEEALRVREEIRVDPFRTGFSHRAQPASIDLNAVRLCFQVFLEGAVGGKFTVPLAPVVSDPIYDKKSMSDLVICKLSDCCCTAAGGKEMILLCEKVAKEDIQVRFFEERDGHVMWEALADFQPAHVHKQVAISFRAPRYRVLELEQPVNVLIQLRRPSDGATSDPRPFQFIPLDSDPMAKRRRKSANGPGAHVLRHLHAEAEKQGAMQYQTSGYGSNPIKVEPPERGPSPYQAQQQQQQQLWQQQQQHQFNILPQFQSPQHHQHALQQQMMLNRVNAEQTGSGFRPLVNPEIENSLGVNVEGVGAVNSLLNLDSQRCSMEMNPLNQLDSADLEGFNTFAENLPQNFSSNLSLSDIKVSQEEVRTTENQEPGAGVRGGNGNNMTDSLTRLTRNTIQELCTLNNMFNPTRDNTGQ